ncbi:hypothetical protein OESDEN_13189 [Oesophagostomum dentatum]|uniref:Uncharacterized protein n=1 Tax=Oesophagostomum dentatum TaxID=61180 RepID=A0A0B1SQ27_OESDE|nr:hypothetical protein OESDEN_13189 [Oesophagostomum dentatum]
MNRLRLLTRAPSTSKPRVKTTTAAPEEEYEEVEEEVQTTTTRRRPLKKERTARPKSTTTTSAPLPVTTSKSNIWDRFTVSQGSKVPSKNIPFWKRLLSTTIAPPKSVEEVVEASVEEETSPEPSIEKSEETTEPQEQTESYTSEATTPVEDIISTNRPVHKTNVNGGNTEVTEEVRQTTASEKHTFRPLPMTLPPIQGPELAFQKVLSGTASNLTGGSNRYITSRTPASNHG